MKPETTTRAAFYRRTDWRRLTQAWLSAVLATRKAARGFYRTRTHATLKRSDELLPGAHSLERLCGHIPYIAPHDRLPCRQGGGVPVPEAIIDETPRR